MIRYRSRRRPMRRMGSDARTIRQNKPKTPPNKAPTRPPSLAWSYDADGREVEE